MSFVTVEGVVVVSDTRDVYLYRTLTGISFYGFYVDRQSHCLDLRLEDFQPYFVSLNQVFVTLDVEFAILE